MNLLSAIAELPAGQKLPVSRFARECNCPPHVVIKAVEQLVASGALDPVTLRPPRVVAPAEGIGCALFDRLIAEGKARGMTVAQVSLAAVGSATGIYRLKANAPGPKWRARIEAWLGEKVSVPPEKPSSPPSVSSGPLDCVEPMPTDGAALYALIMRVGLGRGFTGASSISQAIFGNGTTLYSMRTARTPKARNLELCAAWLEMPALSESAPATIRPRRPSEPLGTSARRAASAGEAKEATAAARELADEARATRAPGETLAERVKRLAAEIEAHEIAEAASDADARRAFELSILDTPSSLLRRAQRDWPEQCANVREIDDELGLQLGEAWRRVIAAGVDCMREAEA